MTSGGQGSPYFRRYGPELAGFDTADVEEKLMEYTVERAQHSLPFQCESISPKLEQHGPMVRHQEGPFLGGFFSSGPESLTRVTTACSFALLSYGAFLIYLNLVT